jgi:phosphohistidine phosphatase
LRTVWSIFGPAMATKLYFLRHGSAADRVGWIEDDAERPLTPEGRQRVNEISTALDRFGLKLDRIVTSPYVRAHQTAAILARKLGIEDRLDVDARLVPGFTVSHLTEVLREKSAESAILLVGHEPDLSDTLAELIGGGHFKFKKAALARVDLTDSCPLRGHLAWFIPPKLLIGMG